MLRARAISIASVLLLVIVASAGAVTTMQDLRSALREVAQFAPPAASEDAMPPAFFTRVNQLRHRLRDYALGSVIAAARQTDQPGAARELAERRIRAAQFPLRDSAEWMGALYEPTAAVELFGVPGAENWVGIRAKVAIPCGADTSLYFVRLDAPAEGEAGLQVRFLLAKENALESLQDAASQLHLALRPSADGRQLEVATFEASAWCRSNWRMGRVQVLRSAEHPYRPTRLFYYQELALVDEESQVMATATADGYHFRFPAHYWLDVTEPTRFSDIRLQVKPDGVAVLAPESRDPAQFLDHWFAAPWEASRAWTTGRDLRRLRELHESMGPTAEDAPPTELVGVGSCGAEDMVWVGIRQRADAARDGRKLYGLLQRSSDSFRVDRFTDALPSACRQRPN